MPAWRCTHTVCNEHTYHIHPEGVHLSVTEKVEYVVDMCQECAKQVLQQQILPNTSLVTVDTGSVPTNPQEPMPGLTLLESMLIAPCRPYRYTVFLNPRHHPDKQTVQVSFMQRFDLFNIFWLNMTFGED